MDPTLYTADLHLTARPLDDYRWEIFPWLVKQVKNRGVRRVCILGDLTDAKDNHNAVLVNRLTTELRKLSRMCPVDVLMGNHDYVDDGTPFFQFLSYVEGVTFIDQPFTTRWGDTRVLFVPHTRRWLAATRSLEFSEFDRLFFHQAFTGARDAQGRVMQDGVPTLACAHLRKSAKAVAGDIHYPHTVVNHFNSEEAVVESGGKFKAVITYCGSPYPIDFGDEFEPRVLFDDGKEITSIPHPSIRKLTQMVEMPSEIVGEKGDMVKITLALPRADFVKWEEFKRAIVAEAARRELILCGCKLVERDKTGIRITVPEGKVEMSNHAAFTQFCKDNRVPDNVVDLGVKLLEEIQ